MTTGRIAGWMTGAGVADIALAVLAQSADRLGDIGRIIQQIEGFSREGILIAIILGLVWVVYRGMARLEIISQAYQSTVEANHSAIAANQLVMQAVESALQRHANAALWCGRRSALLDHLVKEGVITREQADRAMALEE